MDNMIITSKLQDFINLIAKESDPDKAMYIFNEYLPTLNELEKGIVAFWLASERVKEELNETIKMYREKIG